MRSSVLQRTGVIEVGLKSAWLRDVFIGAGGMRHIPLLLN